VILYSISEWVISAVSSKLGLLDFLFRMDEHILDKARRDRGTCSKWLGLCKHKPCCEKMERITIRRRCISPKITYCNYKCCGHGKFVSVLFQTFAGISVMYPE
jgi:hypothetical protein